MRKNEWVVPKPGLYQEKSLNVMIEAAIPPPPAPDRSMLNCSSLSLFVASLALSAKVTP
jgi:hypothetical protein